ncbi:MAG: class I SAM-dependent methyltransferase [Nanoarchaeota archaeon]
MASIKKSYNKFAGQYDIHPYCRQDSLGSAIEFASQKYLFRKYEVYLKGNCVLDIGTGTVRVAEAFKRTWKAKVFASDISKGMIKFAKIRLKERVIAEYALYLCWKSNVFDLVNSSWAINHIENYKKAIVEMARVTRSGGYVMITVVNPPKESDCKKDKRGNLRYNVSLFNDSRGKPVFLELYRRSKEDYLRAIQAAGLKVLEVSDKTLDELQKLGAIEEKDAGTFDKRARKVMKSLGDCEDFKLSNPKLNSGGFEMRINLTILARKPADSP